MVNIRVRRATSDDRPAVLALWHELERAQRSFRRLPVAADADARLIAAFEAAVSSESQCFLIAEEDDVVVGMVHCHEESPSKMSDERAVEMSRVVVVTAKRGTGIGRALFDAASAFARSRGASFVSAKVFGANEDALAFWQGLGFEPFVEVLLRPVDPG
jgi:ribosomal protein S18 acetylase RimI-like enzyme